MAKASAEQAAIATRDRKHYGLETHTWREEVRARAAELGLGELEVATLLQDGRARIVDGRAEPQGVDERALGDRLVSAEGLTSHANTFDQRAVLQEFACAADQGASVEEVRGQASRFEGRADVIPIGRGEMTSAELVAYERRLIASAIGRAREGAGRVEESRAERAMSDAERPLSSEQESAVRAAVSSGDGTIMRRLGVQGLPVLKAKRRGPGTDGAATGDLVLRQFSTDAPDRLWLTDITEHPTREGKLYCCVVLDAYSRSVAGWSIDNRQAASLVMSALGMAISRRKPEEGSVVHSDHGSQFTSWAFSDRVKSAGLAPSMGRVGDAFDNAMMEAFWGRLQTELLNRKHWRTRLELANAIFEYLEIFHNRKRRHSALGMLTPHEYETLYHQQQLAA